MSYTVHLFAHNGTDFALRLTSSAKDMVRKVERWAKSQGIRGDSLQRGLQWVEKICRGDLQNQCHEDAFEALCWIGDAAMERIRIPEFTDLKRYSFIEEYGVVPGFLQHPAPYQLPRAKEAPPVAGYLPWTEMSSFSFAEFSGDQRIVLGELQNHVDSAFQQLGREFLDKKVTAPRSHDLSREQVRFARQQFLDVLETLVEDNLDLLAVVL